MTKYTQLKRSLQKIGFKVIKRNPNGDVWLTNNDYFICIAKTGIGHFDRFGKYWEEDAVAYYCATKEGIAMSYHYTWPEHEPCKWLGENYKINYDAPMTEIDEKILEAVYWSDAQHSGHYTIDIKQEGLA